MSVVEELGIRAVAAARELAVATAEIEEPGPGKDGRRAHLAHSGDPGRQRGRPPGGAGERHHRRPPGPSHPHRASGWRRWPGTARSGRPSRSGRRDRGRLEAAQRAGDPARCRVPLGVVGIIYEARPNVTVDAAALCVKTRQRGHPARQLLGDQLQPRPDRDHRAGGGGGRAARRLHPAHPPHRPGIGQGADAPARTTWTCSSRAAARG